MKFSIKEILTISSLIIFGGLIAFGIFLFEKSDKQPSNNIDKDTLTENNEQRQTNENQTIPYSISIEKEQHGIISINYPVMSGFSDSQVQISFNNAVKQTVENEVNISATDNYPANWYEAVEVHIVKQSENFISILISKNAYKGGAHDTGVESSAFNYDLRNNKVLVLKNIFRENVDYLSILSKATYNDLIAEYEEKTYGDWFQEGTSPKDENFDAVTFSEQGLEIYFDDYQIGSYASAILGPITISYGTVKEYLNPESVVATQFLR